MTKAAAIAALIIGAWACATYVPAPPAFHIEDVPPAIATKLSLDQRIAVADVWTNLKANRPAQAQKNLARLGAVLPIYAAGQGYAALLTGDLAGAEQDFKQALDAAPDMIPASAGLAQIYEGRGRDDLAFDEYARILKTDPANRWAKPRLESLREKLVGALSAEAKTALSEGRNDDARKALTKALTYAPESADLNIQLARIYEKEKNPAAAALHLKNAIAADPKNKALLRQYADLLYDSGDLGPSLDAYQALAEADPKNEAVATRIADLKAKLGVFELPSQYKAIPGLDAVTREDLAALIAVKFRGELEVPERRTEILVDISTSWAQKFIIKVASLNVMSVSDNHTFQPKKIINRAELAETVDRLIDFLRSRGSRFVPLTEERRIRIADVSPDSYYYPPILRIVSYGVMDLTPQRMFEPERTVPGGEAERVLDVVARLAKRP